MPLSAAIAKAYLSLPSYTSRYSCLELFNQVLVKFRTNNYIADIIIPMTETCLKPLPRQDPEDSRKHVEVIGLYYSFILNCSHFIPHIFIASETNLRWFPQYLDMLVRGCVVNPNIQTRSTCLQIYRRLCNAWLRSSPNKDSQVPDQILQEVGG